MANAENGAGEASVNNISQSKIWQVYAGLIYPVIVAGVTFIVGSLMLPETHGHKIWEEIGEIREVK